MKPQLNEKPPTFCLPNESNTQICLEDHKGKWILIYFYPKDDTPGCTTEACEIKNTWNEFESHNISVFGISGDSPESHKKFKEKHKLPFPLLSDQDLSVIKSYDAYGTKKMFGKEYQGIIRKSFLINPDFVIQKIYPKVQPKKHAKEVLNDIISLTT
jgi:peroxiredoxin Q/BCP